MKKSVNQSTMSNSQNLSTITAVKKLKPSSMKQQPIDEMKSLELVDSFADCEIDELEQKIEKCENQTLNVEKQKVTLSKNKS